MLKKIFVNRRVALLWAGQVVSQTEDTVYQIGLLWLMLEITGRKSLTGLAAAALSAALTGLAAEIIPIQTIYLIIGLGAAATPGFLPPGLREAGRPI